MDATTPETQRNQQFFISVLKEEIENDIDEENSPHCDHNMYQSEHLQLPNHVNYYDSKIHVFEDVKEEFLGDENPQSDYSDNKFFSDNNNRSINFIDKPKIKYENTDEMPLNIKHENKDLIYEVSIEIEKLDKREMLTSGDDTRVHDVSVTHQIANENSSNLLNRNNEQGKIEINVSEGNETKELLHRCQYCEECFNNYGDMFEHLRDDHWKENNPMCDLCGKQCKSVHGLKLHILRLHRLKMSPKRMTQNNMRCTYCNLGFKNKLYYKSHMRLCHSTNDTEYKCDKCMTQYKSKQSLVIHMKRTHYDFGRTFECWCGERFRTPIHLSKHKSLKHTGKTINELHKCEDCDAVFNSKQYLTSHVRRSHCDFGRMFECWCGKEFRTPIHLREHKVRMRCRKSDGICNGAILI